MASLDTSSETTRPTQSHMYIMTSDQQAHTHVNDTYTYASSSTTSTRTSTHAHTTSSLTQSVPTTTTVTSSNTPDVTMTGYTTFGIPSIITTSYVTDLIHSFSTDRVPVNTLTMHTRPPTHTILCRYPNSNTIDTTKEQQRCLSLLAALDTLTTGEGKKLRHRDVRFSFEHAIVVPPIIPNLLPFTPCHFNTDMLELLLHDHPDQLSVALALDTCINGANIGFDTSANRLINAYSTNMTSAMTYYDDTDKAIKDDQLAGFSSPCYDTAPFAHMIVSPIGTIIKFKANGKKKVRVIKNLSYPTDTSVNDHINKLICAYSSFDQAADMIVTAGKGCWLSKLDISNAFRQIKVRYQDWHLLVFRWQLKYIIDVCLPFGLRSAPPIWDRIASKFAYILDKLMTLIYYVDDYLFITKFDYNGNCGISTSGTSTQSFNIHQSSRLATIVKNDNYTASQANARKLLDAAIRVADIISLQLAKDKVEGPSHYLDFLGIEIDTINMTATLPADKLNALIHSIKATINRQRITIKHTQSIIGRMIHASKIIHPARTFISRLLAAVSLANANHAKHVIITPSIKSDLIWWTCMLSEWNGTSVLPVVVNDIHHHIYTDACQIGQGGRYQDQWFSEAWTPQQLADANRDSTLSMPYLELLAIITSFDIWAHRWQGQRMIIHTDCMPVVHILTSGLSQSEPILVLMRHLASLAFKHQISYTAIHIAGVNNVYADALSRLQVSEFLILSKLTLSTRINPYGQTTQH
jgi:hypothetical protein